MKQLSAKEWGVRFLLSALARKNNMKLHIDTIKEKKTIPLFYPYMTAKIRKAANDTLKTRWIGQGPKVDEFEKKIGKKFGLKYPLAVNSGSAALELAYELVGLKPGDEVISTPYTCTATNIPLLRRGVKIVFADILPTTMNIDPVDVEAKITDKTKAIVIVNMGGIESEAYKKLKHFKIPIICDSAQAPGLKNGDYVIYSFQAIKQFTTGDGGLLVCPNKTAYKKAKLLRWFGIDREKKQKEGWQAYKKRHMTFDIELPGFKYHMNDIAASMGIAALEDYDKIISYRKMLFELYVSLLDGVDNISIVTYWDVGSKYGMRSTYWLMTVLVKNRDRFAKVMKQHGIETNMTHIRNDVYKVFGGKRQKLPFMNSMEEQYICLPLHHKITPKDVRFICDVIKKGW